MDSTIARPSTPKWNVDRPFLTGRFHQETKSVSGVTESKGFSKDLFGPGVDTAIGCYHAAIQELIVIDDLLSALVGIEGRYITIRRVHGKDDTASFQVDASMDLALQESVKRIFPLCENYLLINQFVESRSQFKSGLVNHAFAAALRTLLLDYQAMVAQLEHQFHLGKLSIQGLWFYCQPMMGSMQALSIVVKKASASNFIGSVVLNLLQSQAKAMAGDHVVRSLLEKMSQCASQSYLGILERWVYEGVIDDPYGEFFIAENKSLQKESLTRDYDTKYWQHRYSLKDDIPSFLANAAETILITGKYLNVMRECGHSIQVPVAENTKLTTVGSNHRYLECIKAAYDFASGELLNLIKEKYDLMGKLRSIKHYLLLDQEIAKLFPCLFGQPSANLVPGNSLQPKKLKIGVVLSGGQAPGGHNVISGIFDYLQDRCQGSTLYGFRGGPAGIMKCKYIVLTPDYIYPYRNQGGFDMICSGRDKIETPEQFKQAQETAVKLDLDGLVVIGGDDSNTNACLLAENFRSKNLKTSVIGCPKTIDGDLKCSEVPTSFGFDTACKIYAEMIGNVMVDARSTGKYYHFVRLMGRAASHITLECALQTHPNITLIGEEVAAKKLTLKNVTDYIADVICKRADLGYNYGVILIPEGLIDFIPEVQQLIAELNEILAHDTVDEAGVWKKKLTPQCEKLFDILPQAIQEQLMLERDPHGNVQVAKIETEKMLIQMVETELETRKQIGQYMGQFKGQSHFFGYEGRCGLPSNFDSTYCYALGYAAGALLHSGKSGLISSVGNLAAPVAEWTVGGTALTALMDVERRHGKFKPVIKKAMVELEGAPFKKFASVREEWAIKNRYINPGPIQFVGPASDKLNHTLLLELGAQV